MPFRHFLKRIFAKPSHPPMEEPSTPPAPPFVPLRSETDWQQVLDRSTFEPVVVFKHSLTCGISTSARRRLYALTESGDPPVYELVIQEARPLSNAIASHLGVHHESPQVLVLREGRVVYHTSHGLITPERLRAATATPAS
jgi:thioredoxin 1